MRFALPATLCLCAALLAGAGVARAERVSEHGAWTVYKEKEATGPLCFLSSQPTKAEGKYTKRGEIFAIVSHRPNVKSTNEVSFQTGYAYQADSEASVSIDRQPAFKLFTRGEGAWTYDKKSDEALVAAMKKGTTMVVRGISSRGTATTDTYSLQGFTAAHAASLAACAIR